MLERWILKTSFISVGGSFKLIFYFLAKITEVKIEPTNRANKEFCMHGFSINTSEKEASPL